MNKEELKQLIQLNRKIGGYLTLNYFSLSDLNSTKELYDIYYSGFRKIEIGLFYRNLDGKSILIKDDNIDDIVEDLYNLLLINISNEILLAFKNFGWEFEELKYFDGDKKSYNKFKKEVLRLKELK